MHFKLMTQAYRGLIKAEKEKRPQHVAADVLPD
jgi:hypothetical protein